MAIEQTLTVTLPGCALSIGTSIDPKGLLFPEISPLTGTRWC
jgi:hypothetical protein